MEATFGTMLAAWIAVLGLIAGLVWFFGTLIASEVRADRRRRKQSLVRRDVPGMRAPAGELRNNPLRDRWIIGMVLGLIALLIMVAVAKAHDKKATSAAGADTNPVSVTAPCRAAMQALADYAAQTDPPETTLEARTLTACTTPLEWMQAAEHLRGNGDHVVIQGTKTSAYDELNAFCQGHMNEPACADATPG